MEEEFEYLETVTTYIQPGYAYCRHKDVSVEGQRGMYRVPCVTSATDRQAAVRTLANTLMRTVDNCTHEMHAIESMRTIMRQVRARANYTKSMTKAAWRGLAGNARYAQFAQRWAWITKTL